MLANQQKIATSAAAHGPSELDRVDYLDGWRGLAIGLVLFAHFAPNTGSFDFGRAGVDVFFCLSGFLMSNILFLRRVPLGTFYKRRVSRILPVFFLFAITVFVSSWYLTGSFRWQEFLATATFLSTYFPAHFDIWQSPLPIGHLWSLNAEEHCYVFLSVLTLFALLRAREAWVLIGAGVLTIAIHVVYIKFPSTAPAYGDLGTEVVASHLLLSAGYFLIRQQFLPLIRPWMPIAAFIAAMSCYSSSAPWWSSFIVSPFLLAFCVNHLSETPHFVRRMFGFQWIRLLGIWSYSIYIWQQPFYKFQKQFLPGVAFFVAVAVSICSFYLFENPVRAWLNKNWHR